MSSGASRTEPTVPDRGAGSAAGSGGGQEGPDRLARRRHPTAGKILAAAKRILTERGYQGLTLQAIAEEAQVNKAGVWYYFGGKQQLVLALLEEVAVHESLHFGALPSPDATLAERVGLLVGSADQVRERVERYVTFYQLLPEASRDAELRQHIMAYYERWYEWADRVLAPASQGQARDPAGPFPSLGQLASILLDGIFMQMVVRAPSFDLDGALEEARQSLLHVASLAVAGPG